MQRVVKLDQPKQCERLGSSPREKSLSTSRRNRLLCDARPSYAAAAFRMALM